MYVLAYSITAQAVQDLTHTDCSSGWPLHWWEAAWVSSGPTLTTVPACLSHGAESCHFKWLLLKASQDIVTSPFLAHDLPPSFSASFLNCKTSPSYAKHDTRDAQGPAMFLTAKGLQQSRDAHRSDDRVTLWQIKCNGMLDSIPTIKLFSCINANLKIAFI